MDILVEKINVSDDKFLLSKLFVGNGCRVAKGDQLFTTESSKATVVTEAPCSGVIFFNNGVEEMELYPAGFCIAKIVDTNENPFEKAIVEKVSPNPIGGDTSDAISIEPVITSGALQLMKENGIQASQFDNQFIAKCDVLRLLNGSDKAYKGNDIVIVAGGGLCKMQIDAIRESHCYNIIGILDDGIAVGTNVYGYKVLGGNEMLPVLYEQGLRLAVNAIGSIASSQKESRFTLRKRMAEKIKSMGYIIPNIIHPRATVESSVKMGEGNVIMAGAYVGSDVVIGDNCLINNHAVVSHDSILSDCVRISPNATLAGEVEVGNNSLIGMNTTVFIGVKIGENVIIYNGMNVFANVVDNSIVK